MDNMAQIELIKHFHQHLKRILHLEIDINSAAEIWIERYAQLWREKQQSSTDMFNDLLQQ